MNYIAYFCLALMGGTLGMLGAGGSILSIPILVYLLGIPIIQATSYSLAIVGCTALVGVFRYRDRILFQSAFLFAIPSVISVLSVRCYVIPALPDSLGAFPTSKAMVILLLFFMALAGFFMVRKTDYQGGKNVHSAHGRPVKLVAAGLSLGFVVGLLGAGGGFLIIPALVLLMGLSMIEAVPASLFVITLNSAVGFLADIQQFPKAEWMRLSEYVGCAILGMLAGIHLSQLLFSQRLKQIFGIFIWGVAVAIGVKEFIL